MDITLYIITIVAVGAAAAVAAWLAGRNARDEAATLRHDNRRLRERHDALVERIKEKNDEIMRLSTRGAVLENQLGALQQEREQLQKQSRDAFANLANEILERQTAQMKERGTEQLGQLLAPLRERLEEFKKQVDDYNRSHIEGNARLEKQLQMLGQLNQDIGREAKELTNALRSNVKTQGDWGEHVLEQILNMSGLRRDENYILQATQQVDGTTIKDDDGNRLRPDVLLKTPGRQLLVIDSKVSLSAFVSYVNEQDPQQAQKHLQAHLRSVREHIDELVERDYASHIEGAMPMVMMFVPNEPAYLTAMTHGRQLWDYAYKHRVVIVSPTHLMAVLQLLFQLWERDKQGRNSQEIARRGGELHDKLVAFLDDMADIDRNLKRAQDAYDRAYGKLSTGRGNVIKRADDLRQLGAKASKQLPQNDTE